MQSIILFLSLISLPVFAATPAPPFAKIEKLVGKALFNGKEIHEGDSLIVNGNLQTLKRSFLRIRMDIWNSSIVIGADTQMALDLTSPKSANPKRYELKDGLCRWISAMKGKQLTGSHVFTKSAAMGVRGTDFEIRNRDKEGETEIIVFDGEVLLKSNLADSEALVKAGQWGGVGGKFGKTVAKPKSLSPAALEEAEARSKALAVKKQSSPNSNSDY
jgi:hypothetical protein